MDTSEKFYTQILARPYGQKFSDASQDLIYAIMEASHSGRTLLVPRIELNKSGNFHIPPQSGLADYFDLPKTVVTHKKKPMPFSCIGTAEWPDTTGHTVANFKPDKPLDRQQPEQLVVRYLPVAKSYFPARYGHRIEISGNTPLWMPESYGQTTVRLQLAPLWKTMADQTIASLGGEGAYRVLALRHIKRKRKKANSNLIVAEESKVLKAIQLTIPADSERPSVGRLYRQLCDAITNILNRKRRTNPKALETIQPDVPADRPIYLVYERSSAGPAYRQFCDAITETLNQKRNAFSYRSFPELRALIETENLLILDNFALTAIERRIQEAAQKVFALNLYYPEKDA